MGQAVVVTLAHRCASSSRGPSLCFLQIWQNYRNGGTGQLSFITVLLQFGGSAARVATTLIKNFNMPDLLNYGLTAGLNGLVFAQVVWYWNSVGPVKQAPVKKVKSGKAE